MLFRSDTSEYLNGAGIFPIRGERDGEGEFIEAKLLEIVRCCRHTRNATRRFDILSGREAHERHFAP